MFQLSRAHGLTAFWLILFALFRSSAGISININSEAHETIATSTETTTFISLIRNDSESGAQTILHDRLKRLLPYLDYYIPPNMSNADLNAQKFRRYNVYELKKLNPERRLPYNNYGYSTDGRRILTPFLKTNALTGTFIPLIRQPKQQPDYSAIYGKLWVLKSKHQQLPLRAEMHADVQKHYIQKSHFPSRHALRKTKTFLKTYSPTNIDIPPILLAGIHENNYHQEKNYYPFSTESASFRNNIKPFIDKQVVIDIPADAYIQRHKETQLNYKRPITGLQRAPIYYPEEQVQRPVILTQGRPIFDQKYQSYPIVEENYVAQKYINRPKIENLKSTDSFHPDSLPVNYFKYESDPPIQPLTPSPPIPTRNENFNNDSNQLLNDSSNSLSLILKKLQDVNALPHSLTVDNIDNSIRTLVKILNSLKNHRQFLKPIVVADNNEDYKEEDNMSTINYDIEISKQTDVPGISQNEPVFPETTVNIYPEDTQEGGTPGIPGVDYPALNSIPPTSFNCKTQRYKGFFGDPHTNCQVWHYCDLNGGKASFLCPNGTIFSQVALTCDWWYNVKCSLTSQLYVLNERLYKYILPFAPKFPEDYTGPLVDKYLALKFMEMEEKMKRERKGKEEISEQTTSIDETTEQTTTADEEEQK